jgi:hypothetical protein
MCQMSEVVALYNQKASEPRTEEAIRGKLKRLGASKVEEPQKQVCIFLSSSLLSSSLLVTNDT